MRRNFSVIDRLTNKKLFLSSSVTTERHVRLLSLDKTSLMSVAKFVFIIFSLASAHYMGFLTQVPFEILSIVAVDFLPAFISLFAFYFLLSYTIAKVFSFVLSQLYLSSFYTVASIGLRVRRHWPERFNRVGAKIYREASRAENIIYWMVFALVFLFVFNFSYVRVQVASIGEVVWVFSVGVFIALLFKAGLGARGPLQVVRRMFDRNRIAYRRRLLSALLYFVMGVSLTVSFYTGIVRFEKLVSEDEVSVESKLYVGRSNILIKSGGALLVFNKSSNPQSYIYITDDLLVHFEVRKKSE